ncbi:MAG: dethiobiotin synthase [Eikenella sp.]|nr:dethiobiotin synthase [Eikenella sp.]
MRGTYFIGGIDTDAGKTFATGYLAARAAEAGGRVITHKPVQTGCTGLSDDIARHRAIMGCGLLPEDREKLTMPQMFPYPCSPHLAAALAGRAIDFAAIHHSLAVLQQRYDTILIEGAGGLLVPLRENYLQIDWVREQQWPVILVSSGKLGSINHTLLSLEALRGRGIPLAGLAYNDFFRSQDDTIHQNTRHYLQGYLKRHFPEAAWWDIPCLTGV